MTLDLHQLLLLGLLSTSVHWLVARSSIAEPLWSRARGRLGDLLRCPACSGWWLGLGLGALGITPVASPHRWIAIVAAGLLAVVLTPVVEAGLLFGLQHSAIPPEPEEPEAAPLPTLLAEPASERELEVAVSDRLARARFGLPPDER